MRNSMSSWSRNSLTKNKKNLGLRKKFLILKSNNE
ncbi:hypothetical protein AYI69_g10792, partial [Smittium culicis]